MLDRRIELPGRDGIAGPFVQLPGVEFGGDQFEIFLATAAHCDGEAEQGKAK
jgi:hypothetical protein